MDSQIIHKLAWQLGYKPTFQTVSDNIQQMLTHPDYELVVCLIDGSIVGWMSLSVRYRIEDVSFLQVAALVTDESVRSKGVGRRLMEYAANFARDRGLSFVGLHSSKPRVAAHEFYEHIGYNKTKESFFFRKDIL